MLGIGFGELTLVALVLIVVLGPERLPVFMKTVGKGIRGLRQASRDIRSAVGIDELLNDDMGYRPPPRRQPPAQATPKIGPEPPPALAESEAPSLPVKLGDVPPADAESAAAATAPPTGVAAVRGPNLAPPPMAVARGALEVPDSPPQSGPPTSGDIEPSSNGEPGSDGDV